MKKILNDIGVMAMTVTRVNGYGFQKGKIFEYDVENVVRVSSNAQGALSLNYEE